eukprot:362032-Chlamydomonas_euryale.AAC.1
MCVRSQSGRRSREAFARFPTAQRREARAPFPTAGCCVRPARDSSLLFVPQGTAPRRSSRKGQLPAVGHAPHGNDACGGQERLATLLQTLRIELLLTRAAFELLLTRAAFELLLTRAAFELLLTCAAFELLLTRAAAGDALCATTTAAPAP